MNWMGHVYIFCDWCLKLGVSSLQGLNHNLWDVMLTPGSWCQNCLVLGRSHTCELQKYSGSKHSKVFSFQLSINSQQKCVQSLGHG